MTGNDTNGAFSYGRIIFNNEMPISKTNNEASTGFSATKIRISGNETAFKFDLLGHTYNDNNNGLTKSFLGCFQHALNFSELLVLTNQPNTNRAKRNCQDHCRNELRAAGFASFTFGFQQVGQADWGCLCDPLGFDFGTYPAPEGECGSTIGCDSLVRSTSAQLVAHAGLNAFLLSHEDFMRDAGNENDTVVAAAEPNICDYGKVPDVATAFLAVDLGLNVDNVKMFVYNQDVNYSYPEINWQSWETETALVEPASETINEIFWRIVSFYDTGTESRIRRKPIDSCNKFAFGVQKYCDSMSQTSGCSSNNCNDIYITFVEACYNLARKVFNGAPPVNGICSTDFDALAADMIYPFEVHRG